MTFTQPHAESGTSPPLLVITGNCRKQANKRIRSSRKHRLISRKIERHVAKRLLVIPVSLSSDGGSI